MDPRREPGRASREGANPAGRHGCRGVPAPRGAAAVGAPCQGGLPTLGDCVRGRGCLPARHRASGPPTPPPRQTPPGKWNTGAGPCRRRGSGGGSASCQLANHLGPGQPAKVAAWAKRPSTAFACLEVPRSCTRFLKFRSPPGRQGERQPSLSPALGPPPAKLAAPRVYAAPASGPAWRRRRPTVCSTPGARPGGACPGPPGRAHR